MKKKLLLTVLTAACAALLVGGAAACSPKENNNEGGTGPHEHELGAWEYDSLTHWRTCKICGERLDKGDHTDNVCIICEYDAGYISTGFTYLLNLDGASYMIVDRGTCADADVVIPAYYEGKPVTIIGEKAFWTDDSTKTTSVVIGPNVKTIAPQAFYMCSKLTRVTFGDRVTEIGKEAFYNCSALTRIELPDSVVSIGESAFENCKGITDMVIPDSVTEIESSVFSGSSLQSVKLGAGVLSIGKSAFSGCSALSGVMLNDGLKEIGELAFQNCTALTEITIPNSVQILEASALRGCKGLTNVTLGEGLTEIGERAFDSCTALSSVKMGNGVEEIGQSAFNGCTSLENVAFSARLASIGDRAFWDCASLKNIELPASLTSIGERVFYNCTALESIRVDGEGTTYRSEGNCLIERVTGVLVVGCKSSVLPTDGSVTAIGPYAFENCLDLEGTDLVIPEGVIAIMGSAFYNSSLESIVLPASLEKIEGLAFSRCSALTRVTMSEGILSIGESAFESCRALEEISFPDSLTKIGAKAFYGCGLKTAALGKDLVEIGESAFENLALSEVSIGENVTSIGAKAFLGCTLIERFVINEKNPVYSSGGEGANCLIDIAGKTLIMGFRSTVIPNDGSVTAIGDGAFEGTFNGLGYDAFEIPDAVTSIGENAFYQCHSLTLLTIGSGVKSIGKDAFYWCSNLELINYKGTKAEFGAISKPSDWYEFTSPGGVTVNCTDGVLVFRFSGNFL